MSKKPTINECQLAELRKFAAQFHQWKKDGGPSGGFTVADSIFNGRMWRMSVNDTKFNYDLIISMICDLEEKIRCADSWSKFFFVERYNYRLQTMCFSDREAECCLFSKG